MKSRKEIHAWCNEQTQSKRQTILFENDSRTLEKTLLSETGNSELIPFQEGVPIPIAPVFLKILEDTDVFLTKKKLFMNGGRQ